MNQEKMGKFISELRKEKGMTQQELADKLIVDRATVSKWERGEYIPNITILLELQNIFDVTMNEILYGDRKNSNNNNEIDSVPINIMNDGKKKAKKILIISSSIIIILITSFFVYYFINNYNSIKVYKIYGENEDFYINDGIMIVSREKSYIKIGDLKNKSDKKISKLELYFIKNDKKHLIISGGENDTELLLENIFGYNELFAYKDIGYIINNLYLEIIYENNESNNLNLNLKKSFSNNNLFNNKNLGSISDKSTIHDGLKIPKYVTEEFILNESDEKYYKETKKNNCTDLEEYFYNVNLYVLSKEYGNYTEYFLYYFNDDKINHYTIRDGIMSENYTYNFKNNKCDEGECNLSNIDVFNKNYLEKIK